MSLVANNIPGMPKQKHPYTTLALKLNGPWNYSCYCNEAARIHLGRCLSLQ